MFLQYNPLPWQSHTNCSCGLCLFPNLNPKGLKPKPDRKPGHGLNLIEGPETLTQMKIFSGEKSIYTSFFWGGITFPIFMFWWNLELCSAILKPNAIWSFKPAELKSFSKVELYCQSSLEWSLRVRNKLTNAMTMDLDFSVYKLYYLLPVRHGGKMATILSSSWTEVQLPGVGILVNWCFQSNVIMITVEMREQFLCKRSTNNSKWKLKSFLKPSLLRISFQQKLPISKCY